MPALTTTRLAFAGGLFIGVILGIGTGAAIADVTASAEPWVPALPACQFEDGNPDGSACDWTDPDTGAVFHVESHNYRDPACSDICLGA